MLDETIDTMALAMANFTLDQVEQQLQDQGNVDLAEALQKLQIDSGYHMAAISGGFGNPEEFIEQKIRSHDGALEAPLSDDVIAQIKSFEPLTHERLKMLVTIENLLPEGDLRNDLKALNDELAQNTPTPATPAQSLKPDNLTP